MLSSSPGSAPSRYVTRSIVLLLLGLGSLCTCWGGGVEVSDLLCRCKMTLGGGSKAREGSPEIGALGLA